MENKGIGEGVGDGGGWVGNRHRNRQVNAHAFVRSGKTDTVQFKGPFKQCPFYL